MPGLRGFFIRGFALAVAISAGAGALAADRVALVIGNAAYQTQTPLANPANDAADVSAMLRKLGFEVIDAIDLDRRGFDRKLREFRDKLEGSSVALLFYAGHGMQVGGRNFIVPVDAQIEKASDVDLDAVDLNVVMQQMRGEDRVNIVILDACRDNPFARSVSRSAGATTRAAQSAFEGLAEVKSSVGTHIIFATDPGNVASDGSGRNSPFTAALLRNAVEPAIDLSRLMMKVRFDVIRATQSKQVPWESSSLLNPVYLAGEPPESPVQQVALRDGDSRVRTVSPAGVPPAPGRVAPTPPQEDFGALCDKFASDRQDPLRSRNVPVVRNVDWERAIPACEKALEKSPKTLRYSNQLGRSLLAAGRHADALRIYSEAAERGSAYATADMGYINFRGWGGVKKNFEAARLWSEKAALMGVSISMSNLGYMYATGFGGVKDMAKAISWYRRGMALNEPQAFNGLAQLYQEGRGVPLDLAKARELFEKAAALDDPEALRNLGYFAENGLAGPRDFDEARRYYELAAAAGHAPAMTQLGFLYRNGSAGVPRDFKIAREWLTRAAKLNDPSAMFGLGVLHRFGEGVEADVAVAREFLESAASHDLTHAMRWLADMHADGAFGKPDREAAIAWLRRAVELEDDEAREQLGLLERPEAPGEACDRMAASGADPLRPASVKAVTAAVSEKAIPACEAAMAAAPGQARYLNQFGRALLEAGRYEEARRLFETPAAAESAYAQLWLGNFFHRGLGVERDPARGVAYYEKAAALGSRDAIYNLARSWSDGTGVSRDIVKARFWYERGARLGEPGSMRDLARLYYDGGGVRRDYVVAREWYEKAAAQGDATSMHQLGVIHERGLGTRQNGKIARQWYAQAAATNHVAAMLALADLYISGVGGNREPQKARGLLEQAAGADDAGAMTKLAQAHLAGVFGEPDEVEARKWLARAADLGNATARSMLAQNSGTGSDAAAAGDVCDRNAGQANDPLRSISVPTPPKIDAGKAVPACEAALAASPGTLRYANQLGIAYVAAGRNFDAMRIFRSAAEKGSVYAMLWTGNLHERGLGTPKNLAEGMRWHAMAAENGFGVAAFNLGVSHYNLFSDGVEAEKNIAAARDWFEKAAVLGNPDAMFQMSVLHENGEGVAADAKQQLEWLERAADFGNGPALQKLGEKYVFGVGVEKDFDKAREYFERAVAANTPRARAFLARFHIHGAGGLDIDKAAARRLLEEGIDKQETTSMTVMAKSIVDGVFGPPDMEEARRLLRLATDLGDATAKADLDKLR